MPLDATGFDWKHPDYLPIIQERARRLKLIREKRKQPGGEQWFLGLCEFYKTNPWQFIEDWGVTFDPRITDQNAPAIIPFVLFQKQIDWLKWAYHHWLEGTPGLTEKSRDCGVSWLSVSLSCTLCIFYKGVNIGLGSRKQEYVDLADAPKSLFFKARQFMDNVPEEFRAGWIHNKHSPHMRMIFPNTTSYMNGEVGDNIGRGDRTSLYLVDEAAYLEHPSLVESALISTTRCRIDVSSANGPANVFAEKRHAGVVDVFTFHWRDDPRKDDAWYAKICAETNNPIIIASEIDIDYTASIEGVLIPSQWIQAAIGAAEKLGFEPTGIRLGALDVADEGRNTNAFCGAHGVVVQDLEEWSGKGGDIFQTVEKAFSLCEERDYEGFRYDTDGLGAGVRGDSKVIQQRRHDQHLVALKVQAYRGSAEVAHPERQDVKDRRNKDFFANLKAQSWWSLRTRFNKTFRAIVEGMKYNPDELISLDPGLKLLSKLVVELTQPTYTINGAGKILIDKTPEGMKSPNLADAVVIRFAPIEHALVFPDRIKKWAAMPTHPRRI